MSQVTGSDPHHSSMTINHFIVTKQRAPFTEKCFACTYAISLIFTAKGTYESSASFEDYILS